MKHYPLERIVQSTRCIAIGLVALQGWLFPALLSGFDLGIMDPALSQGSRTFITDSDLMALEAMGYTIQDDQTSVAWRADDHAVSVSFVR